MNPLLLSNDAHTLVSDITVVHRDCPQNGWQTMDGR